VKKKIKNVRITFKILNGDDAIPSTFQQITCHMIFDVKMEDFRRKTHFVARGDTTDTPHAMMYTSVLLRESVRIALTLAALNDLDVKMADIENAYLAAHITEKVWTVLGPESGVDDGKNALIVRALYGLKSSGTALRKHLAECMAYLGWTPCRTDRESERWPDDGVQYWAYIMIYVDNILCVHHKPGVPLTKLYQYFKMKNGSIQEPTFYLGAKLNKTTLQNGVIAWAMSSRKYVQSAVQNVKECLAVSAGGHTLKKRAYEPFPLDYRPELDVTPELTPVMDNFYQTQIGVLRWCMELGCIDIMTGVSLLSSHLCLLREKNVDTVYHLAAHFALNHNARVVFDPTYPQIDEGAFINTDWKAVYGDVEEAFPIYAPTTLGKEVDLRLYMEPDHAREKFTRRSRTGFVIYLNMAPNVWFSKQQPTVESSVFGAEIVEMKNGIDSIRGIHYKLRMMGVPLSGPCCVYGDNMSVIHNLQRPESVLKKEPNSICYHVARESTAMGECIIAHVRSENNPVDIYTKVVPAGQKRHHLIGFLLYDLAD
jgi:hypothetical protein